METLTNVQQVQQRQTQRHKNYSNLRHLYATLKGRIYCGPPQDIEDLLAALSFYSDSYPVSSFVTVDNRSNPEVFWIEIKLPEVPSSMVVHGRISDKVLPTVVFHTPGEHIADTANCVPVSELHEHYWNFLERCTGLVLAKE